jgi:hypothetical protein
MLFSFVLDEDIPVFNIHTSGYIFSHFALPLSNQGHEELQLVSPLLLDAPVDTIPLATREFSPGVVQTVSPPSFITSYSDNPDSCGFICGLEI